MCLRSGENGPQFVLEAVRTRQENVPKNGHECRLEAFRLAEVVGQSSCSGVTSASGPLVPGVGGGLFWGPLCPAEPRGHRGGRVGWEGERRVILRGLREFVEDA